MSTTQHSKTFRSAVDVWFWLLAAPALSLDRLEIRHGRYGTILVSPREREAFLAAIGHPSGETPPPQAAS